MGAEANSKYSVATKGNEWIKRSTFNTVFVKLQRVNQETRLGDENY